MKKPNTGYKKKKKPKKIKEHYIGKLLVANPKKITFNEKIVKFLIFLALRIVIKPKKWKNPKKNYEIIDRTYKRIMSADFIFIPSSIAFYLIMAIMPILSLITFLYQIPIIQNFLVEGSIDPITGEFVKTHDYISDVLGRFIPGMSSVLASVRDITDHGHIIHPGAIAGTIISLIISTWIAAGGFAKLVFTQSYLYGHKFVGGYWMNKIKGMFMVVCFSLFLVIILIVNIWVTSAINSSNLNGKAKTIVKTLILVIGLYIAIFIGFVSLYKLSPRYKIAVKHVIPGAAVTTIPTAGFLALFGIFTSLWSYGNYGIIGIVMYIGMSSLLITYFIFVGLSANVAYYRTFVGVKLKTKWTLSKK